MSDSEEPVGVLLQASPTKSHHRKTAAVPWPSRSGNTSSTNILAFAFENVVINGSKWSAECLHCLVKRTKSDKKGTTSNFLSHVRQVHPAVFAEYAKTQKSHPTKRGNRLQQFKEEQSEPIPAARGRRPATAGKRVVKTVETTSNGASGSGGPSTSLMPLRHTFLNDLMLQQVIIGDGMSCAFGEQQGFRMLVRCIEPGWNPLSGTEVLDVKAPLLVKHVKDQIKMAFAAAVAVSLTVDLRRRDGFRGMVVAVSGHAVLRDFSVISELLDVKLIQKMSNADASIEFVREVIGEYSLAEKTFCLVNGGFKDLSDSVFSLPEFGSESPNARLAKELGSAVQDISDTWHSNGTLDDGNDVDMSIQSVGNSFEILPPFAHSLQLVIRDGFEACRSIEPMLALLSRLSGLFAVANNSESAMIEDGKSPSSTWTQQLKLLRQIFTLDVELDGGLTINEATTTSEVRLDADELALLHTFVDILRPFEQATDRAQRDTHASVSTVVPHISGIYRRLLHFFSQPPPDITYQRDTLLEPFLNALKDGLELRFAGLLSTLGYSIETPVDSSTTFGEDLYLAATFLDPTYKDYWVEDYVPGSHRKLVEAKMRSVVQRLTLELSEDTAQAVSQTQTRLPSDDSGLDSFRRPRTTEKPRCGVESEMSVYYQDVSSETELVEYWALYDKKFPRLAKLVRRLLSIPANSTKFPVSFPDSDWIDWNGQEGAVSLAFLRCHKSSLPLLKPPSGSFTSVKVGALRN